MFVEMFLGTGTKYIRIPEPADSELLPRSVLDVATRTRSSREVCELHEPLDIPCSTDVFTARSTSRA